MANNYLDTNHSISLYLPSYSKLWVGVLQRNHKISIDDIMSYWIKNYNYNKYFSQRTSKIPMFLYLPIRIRKIVDPWDNCQLAQYFCKIR